jgi:hypothetical protein
VPSRGDDHVVAHQLQLRQRLAVDLAVGDERCEVVGGSGSPRRGELAEVTEEVEDDFASMHRLAFADRCGGLGTCGWVVWVLMGVVGAESGVWRARRGQGCWSGFGVVGAG